jgi:hypothetical protein
MDSEQNRPSPSYLVDGNHFLVEECLCHSQGPVCEVVAEDQRRREQAEH